MRVFVVGGTGFLGYHVVQSCLSRGWQVTALGLPPAPPRLGRGVKLLLQDFGRTPDAELRRLLRGHDAVVFAAGMDERSTPARPAYPRLRKANVEDLARVLHLARDAGATRAVVLGSYFSYLDRVWPALRLAEHHPYIRSRIEQARAAGAIPGLDGMVVELPYVFGALPLPGWEPLWTPLVRYIRLSPLVYYTAGGSACISVGVAGEAVAAAIERGTAGERYPIGQENLSWAQLLARLARADRRTIRVLTVPTPFVRFGFGAVQFAHRLQGKEGGLDLPLFTAVQTAQAHIDPARSRQALGYALDDLDQAFRDTVAAVR
ncbi:MAG: NAD(P)H-binding protein [Gammaproteobacteria bacterium]|jgi:dihydroflavonol-4-reductase|nr:NAD(P)H-binding protein [Gammaproteobacteria bacterium]MBK8990609.1 NAD(P)H-binding protein [Gammaproteobacteria bacterium]MBK9466843.1 NAD(P)H-binding protein [Gammaproteobacteria bacterium]MBP6482387.1 NAD(P)H-binding protein [Pseudomonadales bacterium]